MDEKFSFYFSLTSLMMLFPPCRHLEAGTGLTTAGVPKHRSHSARSRAWISTSGLASRVRQSSDWATMAGHNQQLGWERGVEWSGVVSSQFVPLLFELNIYHHHCHA